MRKPKGPVTNVDADLVRAYLAALDGCDSERLHAAEGALRASLCHDCTPAAPCSEHAAARSNLALVTDDQIRELRDGNLGTTDEDVELVTMCHTALGLYEALTVESVQAARARCAEIVNARAKER